MKLDIEFILKEFNVDTYFDKRTSKSLSVMDMCRDNNQVVFEQDAEYFFNYIVFSSNFIVIKMKSGNILPVVFKNNSLFFAYPFIQDWAEMSSFIRYVEERFRLISIKYLSEEQSKKYYRHLMSLGFKKQIRSANELFYSTRLLSELSGSEFAKLRYKRNIINKMQNIKFEPLSPTNIGIARSVLDKWNDSRLHIYKKDKKEQEFNYLKNTCVSDFGNTMSYILYFNNLGVGVLSLSLRVSQKTLCTTILKGINELNGLKTRSSDCLYFLTFKIAESLNLDYINDGDQGKEVGTINHKQQFKPIYSRKTYDYVR